MKNTLNNMKLMKFRISTHSNSWNTTLTRSFLVIKTLCTIVIFERILKIKDNAIEEKAHEKYL